MRSTWRKGLFLHMGGKSIPFCIFLLAQFPLHRAHWGKPFSLTARYLSSHSHQPDDFDLSTHTNETVAAVRRHISKRLAVSVCMAE